MLLIGAPRALTLAFEQRMHGVEDQPEIIAFDVDDPLGAQDVRAVLGQQRTEPRIQCRHVQRHPRAQRNRLKAGVMQLSRVRVMPVRRVVATIFVVHMRRVFDRRGQEARLECLDPLEIETAAAEHAVEPDVAAPRAMDRRKRVDAAQARLDRIDVAGASTRSVLFSTIWLAKAICSAASKLSARRRPMWRASTTVVIESSWVRDWSKASTRKVCATGPGSASPVVSTMMASNGRARAA